MLIDVFAMNLLSLRDDIYLSYSRSFWYCCSRSGRRRN